MTASTATASHEHRCLRCGRKLTATPGPYGPVCARKVRQAAGSADLAAWTPAQAAKALELIEDGALVPAAAGGEFLAVSADGTEVYRATASACSCPAGEKGTRCYHRCAVVITLASLAPAGAPLALAA
jgi:hypothetical protein